MCTKFEMNRSSSFQMAVNTDFEKVVLRKTRLKFMKQKSEEKVSTCYVHEPTKFIAAC